MKAIEKRPGLDWLVYYTLDDEPGTHAMSVFGAATPEQALKDARYSLSEGYEIVGLVRGDVD